MIWWILLYIAGIVPTYRAARWYQISQVSSRDEVRRRWSSIRWCIFWSLVFNWACCLFVLLLMLTEWFDKTGRGKGPKWL